MYKKLAIFLILVTLSVVYFTHNKQEKDPNTFIIGTNTDFPPFSFIDKGIIVGFDIDVAYEVSRRLNKRVVLKDMPFDALIPALTLGNVDFIAAGMTATEERARRVAFSKCYLKEDPLVIVTLVKRDSPHPITLENLEGKTVVVNEGYNADVFLSDKTKLKLTRLPTPADAFIAIKTGRADAFVTAKSTVDLFLQNQDGTLFQYDTIEGAEENCALVVSKDNIQLLADIDRTLVEMEKDGTMEKIKTKWKLQ